MVPEEPERRGLLPRFTLKDDNSFLLADSLGDIQGSDDGLYRDDTRMLSRYEFEIAGRRPSLLGASINQQNTLFTAHLTNRPLPALGEQSIPQGVIHIERRRFLYDARLYERLRFTNYSSQDYASVPVKFVFAADFVDIFEVQGRVRAARGLILSPTTANQAVCLRYRGRDDHVRNTCIAFSIIPSSLTPTAGEFQIPLPGGGMADLFIEIDTRACESGTVPSRERFVQGEERLTANMRSRLAQGAFITTSGRLFNLWVDKSHSDLALLTATLPSGPYPYAGIPWFATQFGRDAIISALQTLWLNPKLSAGVLRFLAETQAQEESTFRDAQPGKILHEMRHGEMAALKEVPFARYYGSVDSTPLFVLLAARYEKRVGDPAVVNSIWPQLRAAIQWIEQRLNNSRTNLLDYASAEPGGLVNQGWKDSADSIFHATGELPRGPIAVVEVQGYVYAAFMGMAQLLLARDEPDEAHRLTLRALAVKTAIEEKFWDPNLNFYGLAIDGGGRLCRVKASNAGHLLFCGVPAPARARSVAAQLLTGEFSSGWGIRTLGSDQTRYNPMSYHNGSVWPHDTAICAAGIARYTDRSEVVQILSEVFEAAHYFGMRLPELYCGFARTEGQSPIPYPVACLPQAWSAGAVFMLLQACLGIEIDGARKEIHVRSPQLPMGIGSLTVDNLEVGGSKTQLQFRRLAEEVVVAPRQTRGNTIRVLVHMGGE